MQQAGQSSAKVSTILTLAPDSEKWVEASPPTTPDRMKQQSAKSKMKAKMNFEEAQRQAATKQIIEMCHKQLREREHYEQLMEREHLQLQDTIRYYRDIDKERTHMFEQLMLQMKCVDEAYFEINVLRVEKRRHNDIRLIQQGEMETLRQTILQQQVQLAEVETLRQQVLQQQNVNMAQSCEVSTLTSELKIARDTIMAASNAAARAQSRNMENDQTLLCNERILDSSGCELQPVTCTNCCKMLVFCSYCHQPMYIADGLAVCLYCQQSVSSGSGLEPPMVQDGKSTTSQACAAAGKFCR